MGRVMSSYAWFWACINTEAPVITSCSRQMEFLAEITVRTPTTQLSPRKSFGRPSFSEGMFNHTSFRIITTSPSTICHAWDRFTALEWWMDRFRHLEANGYVCLTHSENSFVRARPRNDKGSSW